MNWNNITVRQYQQIHPILMSEDTDEEKLYQITLILEGKGITAAEYESKIEQYGFLAQIEVQPKKLDRFSVDTRQDLVTSAQLSSHEKFLTRMVISAMQVLREIALDCGVHIEDLTVDQIIIWPVS